MGTLAYSNSDRFRNDPAEIVKNLFTEKLKLESAAAEAHVSSQIMMINWSLENDLGLENHEQLFKEFKQSALHNKGITLHQLNK